MYHTIESGLNSWAASTKKLREWLGGLRYPRMSGFAAGEDPRRAHWLARAFRDAGLGDRRDPEVLRLEAHAFREQLHAEVDRAVDDYLRQAEAARAELDRRVGNDVCLADMPAESLRFTTEGDGPFRRRLVGVVIGMLATGHPVAAVVPPDQLPHYTGTGPVLWLGSEADAVWRREDVAQLSRSIRQRQDEDRERERREREGLEKAKLAMSGRW
jgi:hypothetical protein